MGYMIGLVATFAKASERERVSEGSGARLFGDDA